MSSTSAEDFEHWPDDATQVSSISTKAASGYNNTNGLRNYHYHPANSVIEEKKDEPAPEPPAVQQPIPYAYQPPKPAIQQQQAQYMSCYPQPPPYPGQTPQQQMACYPAPQYYGYPGYYGGAPMYMPAPAPAPAAPVEEKPAKRASPRKWQGRTKAEVEEDNMKIAAREGAYEARKVEPLGLNEDQMVWVVCEDEDPVLQTYISTKDLQGEWKTDPRFQGSWYFVREKPAEEAPEEENDDGKTCACGAK